MSQQDINTSSASGPRRTPNDLRILAVFRDLDDQNLVDIFRGMRFKKYSKDQVIIGQESRDTNVYFILAGTAHIALYSPSGKEVLFRDLEPGNIFGELFAIDGHARSANAIAKTDMQVGCVSAAQFCILLQEFPQVNTATLKYLCSLVRDLSWRVYQFSAHAVSIRIQTELLRLARLASPTGNTATISPAPTHTDIANRVNTHREAVTKEITNLVEEGVVTRAPRKLVVKDIAALRRMADDTPNI